MIKVENVSKNYMGHEIVKEFSCEIQKGKLNCLTTHSMNAIERLEITLALLALLEPVDSGDIYYKGQKIENIKANQIINLQKEEITYIHYNIGNIPSFSVNHNLSLALENQKHVKKKKRQEILDLVGILELRKEPFSNLKISEKQRFAYAKALLKQEEIIFFNSPTDFLSEEERKKMLDLLLEEVKNGKTVVVSSRDIHVLNIADEIIEI